MIDRIPIANNARRAALKKISASLVGIAALPTLSQAENVKSKQIYKPIPSTGELIPVIGMGTWITFNVGNNINAINNCREVLATFFRMGGTVIDSSPMYGSAEATLGTVFQQLPQQLLDSIFSASKIWTSSTPEGSQQFSDSMSLWKQNNFDLFQVHNLVNWQDHIKTLNALKEQGLVRYIGITTSHGRRHGDFIKIMQAVKPDFIQVTYNVMDRQVEKRILPLATDLGIAVLANRPFQGGRLFNRVRNQPLPEWAGEISCENWAQLFLKYIVSHPAVTCAIPATSQVAHMQENMGAQIGSLKDLPDQNYRKRIESLI